MITTCMALRSDNSLPALSQTLAAVAAQSELRLNQQLHTTTTTLRKLYKYATARVGAPLVDSLASC
jgi:CRISPR/Cas system CSM-associated protein Csm2 small subunit